MALIEHDNTNLIAHVDTNNVSLAELAALPEPIGTNTFRPVHHYTLVQTLRAILENKGIQVVKEAYAVRSDGLKMFGVFSLSSEGIPGTRAAMGFRNGNNRVMKLQAICGLNVFVCDNMAFAGDSIILNRKHTSGLEIMSALIEAVDRYFIRFDSFKAQVLEMVGLEILDNEAKSLIHDVFVQDIMPIRYLPNVSAAYFNKYAPDDNFGHTAWGLHNAFTEVAQDMALNKRMEAIQKVSQVFGLLENGPGNGDSPSTGEEVSEEES